MKSLRKYYDRFTIFDRCVNEQSRLDPCMCSEPDPSLQPYPFRTLLSCKSSVSSLTRLTCIIVLFGNNSIQFNPSCSALHYFSIRHNDRQDNHALHEPPTASLHWSLLYVSYRSELEAAIMRTSEVTRRIRAYGGMKTNTCCLNTAAVSLRWLQ